MCEPGEPQGTFGKLTACKNTCRSSGTDGSHNSSSDVNKWEHWVRGTCLQLTSVERVIWIRF